MLLFHQVAIFPLDNNLASIDLLKELTNIYRFFTGFGKIVDFNLESFPNFIYITYVKHSSVVNLVLMGINYII